MPLYFASMLVGMRDVVEFDWQKRADAAMKMAIGATGLERIKWVRLAQAWYDLGRDRIEKSGSDGDALPRRNQAETRSPGL